MKHKNKRLAAVFLTLCMVLGLLPSMAFAEEYATATLKLEGYTVGANIEDAMLITNSNNGFQSIAIDGFDTSEDDGKFNVTGTFQANTEYYVLLNMPRSTGYELQKENGKPVGVTLEGATAANIPANDQFLIFKMNSAPASGGSTTKYATATLTLSGYTVGANMSDAIITATTQEGFQKVRLAGFKTTLNAESNKRGTFEADTQYYVSLEMPRSDGYTLQMEDGKEEKDGNIPMGISLDGATVQALPENTDYVYFKMNAAPAAAPASGKRTTTLDLSTISVSNTQGATYDNGVYTNTAEGWTYYANYQPKTLVLDNCTIDVADGNGISSDYGLKVELKGTNTITAGDAAIKLTGNYDSLQIVEGDGSLNATGGQYGIDAGANGSIYATIGTVTLSGGTAAFRCTSDGLTVGNATMKAGESADDASDVTSVSDLTDKKYVEINHGGSTPTPPPATVTTRTIPLDLRYNDTVKDTSGNVITADSNGVYTCEAEGWSYDSQNFTLTLSGANFDISGNHQFAIILPQDRGRIVLADGTANKVSIASTYGESYETVAAVVTNTISGGGSLTVAATSQNGKCYGICEPRGGNLALNGCNITIENVESKSGEAGGIYVSNGSLTITANAATDNAITIQKVVGTTTSSFAIKCLQKIKAEGATISNATVDNSDGSFVSEKTKIVRFADAATPVVLSFTAPTPGGGGTSGGGGSSSGGSSGGGGSHSSNSSNSISVPDAKNGTVSVTPKSASKGADVTITVTPDKGYTLETLTVTDKDGKEIELTNQGNGKYTFKMPASKVDVKATFMEDNSMLNHFVDVSASAYYYDAVLWAAENGITGGIDEEHFSPDGICTRAQAVAFLWRAAGSPAPKSTVMPFTDVAAGSYYYDAVLWAVENGIAKGTSDTTFSPDLNCSRGHIVSFLWRSQNARTAGKDNPFTDVKADAYYADAVLWAVQEDVTSGTSAVTFSPDADCTRAQIVTFLYRTYQGK